MVLVADETEPGIVPKVEEIQLPGKMITGLDSIREKLSKIPFYSMKLTGDELAVVRVESRNIHKKPYLFYILSIKKDFISVIYSIPQETSENIRRIYIMKNLASILSIITDDYHIEDSKFYQYMDSAVDSLLSGISQSYSALFNKYDSLLSNSRETKRLNIELSAANRNLTIQAAQLTNENAELKSQLKNLQTYSDESLMAMVQDWITVHNNTIDTNEFSRSYNVPVPRVEQILDKMVSMGYIELKS